MPRALAVTAAATRGSAAPSRRRRSPRKAGPAGEREGGPGPSEGPGAGEAGIGPAAGGPAPGALLVLLVALAAAAGAAALSVWVFGGAPHVSDEASYVFQAKVFGSGRLWLDPPSLPDAFRIHNVVLSATRWCSKYPPGWPLLLALPATAGLPWIANPLLLGLTVLGTWRLGRALYGDRTAWMAAILVAGSPFALLSAAGFMAHVACLCAGTWSLALVVEGVESSSDRKIALGSALAGLAGLVRPVSAVWLLGPAIAFLALRLLRARRARGLGSLLGPAALAGTLLLLVQWATWGSPLATGYTAFEPTESLLAVHGKSFQALDLLREHLPLYLRDLPASLWGIPGPSFWWLLPLLFFRRKGDGLLLASAAVVILGHAAFYWAYDDLEGGPRYAFEAVAAIALLSARVLDLLLAWLQRVARSVAPAVAPLASRVAPAVILAGLLLPNLVLRLPPLARSHRLSFHLGLNDPLRGAAEAGVGPEALVLVRPRIEATGYTPENDPVYHSYAVLNGPDPRRSPRLFVRDIDRLREELIATYPRPEVWRVALAVRPAYVGETTVENTFVEIGRKWTRVR